jgi:amino acid adenylation domain-containing protein
VSADLVHNLLQRSAEAHADRPAVVDRNRQLTYGELERQANRLARLLRDAGVSRHDRVGLFLDKSLESLVAVYGILKAGAAYVPLDPQSPASRLAYIARNADLRCLITGLEKAEAWDELVVEGTPLQTLVALNAQEGDLDRVPAGVRLLTASALPAYSDTPPDASGSETDLAYILYTSGSTGDPKGVMLSHLNAMTFINWAAAQFEVAPSDRLSSHAPLHFDLSIFDLFAAAKAGAAVILVPAEISIFPIDVANWIENNEISIWYSVPSALTMLVLRGNLRAEQFPRLRSILFAGEVFPTKYLVRLTELLPNVCFYNLYGPTETNVCTWYPVPPPGDENPPASLPIGKPISGVEVFAVGDDGKIVRPGEVGELCVKGPSVMQGYWGDPEGTARVLGPLPSAGHEPVYRTGDLVKQAEDGNYVFLGRRDAQIKRRGYRIELGEIETALHAHPSVVECAVVATPDELSSTRITAHVVVRDRMRDTDLVRVCLDRVPRYAVPDAFEFHGVLPKTSTGKIDRKALGTSQSNISSPVTAGR